MAKSVFQSMFASAVAIAIIACQCHAFSPSNLRHMQHKSSRNYFAHKTENVDDEVAINDSADPREGSMAAATKMLGQVPYGETSRKYRRTVFRHEDWVEHRSSSSRILNNLQSMFFSGVVRQLRPQVTVVASVAVFVLSWNWIATNDASLPLGNIDLHVLSIPTLPFTLSSPALGLLLVFRTNAAYARWMRGRDAWARMTRHGMNLVRMASVFSSDVDAVDEFSKVVWLYCRTVMNKLSSPYEDEEVYKNQVKEIFQHSPIAEKVLSSSYPAIAAWKELSVQLHSLPTSDPKSLIETDKSIIILGECATTMEKIYSSPVPLVYTRHTARFLSLWAILLPCALYTGFPGDEWAVLPASGIMAFFLFGVDELAITLEEPFSVLPMQVFCDEVLEANRIMVGKEEPRLDK
jgi:putative membrane protein